MIVGSKLAVERLIRIGHVIRRLVAVCCALGGLVSCAHLPEHQPYEQSSFIPAEESLAVRLASEGAVLYRGSRLIDAELRFHEALFLNPSADKVWINLAAVYEAQGMGDQALEIYGRFLKANPTSLVLLNHLARAHVSTGEYETAERTYRDIARRALDLNEMAVAAAAHRSLSSLEFRSGDEQAAWCDSMQALALKYDLEELLRHARLLIAVGHFSRADKVLQKGAVELGAMNNGPLLQQLALASFALGKLADAQRHAEAALDGGMLSPEGESEAMLLIDAARAAQGEAIDEDDLVERRSTTQERLMWPPPLIERADQFALMIENR